MKRQEDCKVVDAPCLALCFDMCAVATPPVSL